MSGVGRSVVGALVMGAVAAGGVSAAPILGFTDASTQTERALEARFDVQLSPNEIRDRLKLMSSAPNQVGSPHDKTNADYVLAQFKAWGWDAHIEQFEVLYPTPISHSLTLLGASPYEATLTEPGIPGDTSAASPDGALPGWLGYGADGDVTGDLVYVNHGMPEDYALLERMGISVKGKIVITRYGGGWRGLKPKLAQEHGAIGCIIYSDPADDGYGPGDTYPKGAWRPEAGIQRGSVLDIPIRPGDPLTPDVGATADAPRLARDRTGVIMTIPAIPIAYGEARHFLAALTGEVAPRAWRGGLPITYHVGGGGVRVHMTVASDWSLKPIYDVIAVMPGAEAPDQWVIRANHRDGWVYGAWDPLSGQSALLEEARALGALAKTGWRPKRTIVYASWDGEEPGLLGSTEWAEQHAAELKAKAVLYINTDENSRGLLDVDASYATRRLVSGVASDIVDPETGASVLGRAFAAIESQAVEADAGEADRATAKEVSVSHLLPVSPMGSGSDYTPFAQHLGIASIDFGYRGEGEQAGVYHSAYDTFEHFARFGDPDMVYGVMMARTGGRLVLRAADADLVPFSYGEAASLIAEDLKQVRDLADNMRQRATAQNHAVDDKAFALAADPTDRWAPPPKLDPVPAFDFSSLDRAVQRLKTAAAAFDTAAAGAGAGSSPARLARANAQLQGLEQSLTDLRGLPGRPWYKNMVFAPGVLTGYGSKTLPGVRKAIEGRRWDEAREFIERTAQTLDAYSDGLDQATALLKP